MVKRKLPVGGIQTFSELRKEYDVYVDKTSHIYNIASRYKVVFLARPRRFGKSLLCSTIESMFRAEKEVFEGLAISHTDWEWKKHPVIHFDLGAGDYGNNGIGLLRADLNYQISNCAMQYGISINLVEYVSINLKQLITKLFHIAGPVVFIVDEYDNPLLNTMEKPLLNSEIRDELRGFYSVLKQCDQYLRFAFVTGVTKFAQISMFSGFNQPKDISMIPEYCDICGITQNELETCFVPEIEAYAPMHGGREKYLEKLKTFYNGYYFTEGKTAVYNTYGIMNHFDSSAKFDPYWSNSGESSFARRYLESKNVDIVDIENAEMDASCFY